MTDIIAKLVLSGFVIVVGWIIVSPIVFVWWFFDRDSRDRFARRHGGIRTGVYIGAFCFLLVVLARGTQELLVFVPDNWGGTDEDGAFVSVRSTIGSTLGALFSLFLVQVFVNHEKVQAENRRLSIAPEIKMRKDAWHLLGREGLIQRHKETEATLAELRGRMRNPGLSLDEERDASVLAGLLAELACLLEEAEQAGARDDA